MQSRYITPTFLMFLFSCFAMFFHSCSQNDTLSEVIDGSWEGTLTVTFGEWEDARVSLEFSTINGTVLQGHGVYQGPDGSGNTHTSSGTIVGWLNANEFSCYFVDEDDENFIVQIMGKSNGNNVLVGSFNAYLRNESWFHGLFNLTRSQSAAQENFFAKNGNNQQKTPEDKACKAYISESGDSLIQSGNLSLSSAPLDQFQVIEDFEDLGNCQGLTSSPFAYKDSFSGAMDVSSHIASIQVSDHYQNWSGFTRLEFWTWGESAQSAEITVNITYVDASFDKKNVSFHIERTFSRAWQRHVIYFSEFEPAVSFSSSDTIETVEFQLDSSESATFSIYLDDLRIVDDRWFVDVLLSNNYFFENYADSEANTQIFLMNGLYGDLMRFFCHYYRFSRKSPLYHDPWTGFTVSNNNCYQSYRYPFPPLNCLSENTSYRTKTENYNINWLTWENYGRYRIEDNETRYIFYQWNDRFNRHYILSKLASGIVFSGDRDNAGDNISDEDRFMWQQTFYELLSDWMYDYYPPFLESSWGGNAFTIYGDITTAIRMEQWFKFLELLKSDETALPDWLYYDCLKLIYATGQLAEETLRENWYPTNHYALLGFTLYSIGVLYPEFMHGSESWREAGIHAIQDHTFPDGATKEACTHYHTLTLDFMNRFYDLAEFNQLLYDQVLGNELFSLDEERWSMHHYLWSIAQPPSTVVDGSGQSEEYAVPAINDGTGTGVDITRFVERYRQYNTGLSPESFSYLPDVGQMVVRDNLTPEAVYLLFDSGPYGLGAHGHQDKLSFTFSSGGKTFIVDPGGWGGSFNDWDSTAMHNSVTIDSYGQLRNQATGDWTNYEDNVFSISGNVITMAGTYSEGYGLMVDDNPSLLIPASHKRLLTLDMSDTKPVLFIQDNITTFDFHPHTFNTHFHFHPQVARTIDDLFIEGNVLKTKNGELTITALNGKGLWHVYNSLISDDSYYSNVSLSAAAYYSVHSFSSAVALQYRLDVRD